MDLKSDIDFTIARTGVDSSTDGASIGAASSTDGAVMRAATLADGTSVDATTPATADGAAMGAPATADGVAMGAPATADGAAAGAPADVPQATPQKKERIPYFDNARAILIYLVIIGHCLYASHVALDQPNTAVIIFIYSFHMYAFALISGYMTKPNAYSLKGIIPILQIAFVYVLFTFLHVILLYKFGVKGVDGNPFGDSMIAKLKYSSYSLWWLIALVWWRLAMPIIDWIRRKIGDFTLLTLVCIFGLIAVCVLGDGNLFAVMRTITFFPFFYLGYLAKIRAWSMPRGKVSLVLAIAIMAAGAYVAYTIATAPAGKSPIASGSVLEFFMTRWSLRGLKMLTEAGFRDRLAVYAASVLMTLAFMRLVPRRHIPLLSTIGGNTLSVYVWQSLVYVTFVYWMGIPKAFWLDPAHYLLAALIMCIVFGVGPIPKITNLLIRKPKFIYDRPSKKARSAKACPEGAQSVEARRSAESQPLTTDTANACSAEVPSVEQKDAHPLS